jgi:hypothetical protein
LSVQQGVQHRAECPVGNSAAQSRTGSPARGGGQGEQGMKYDREQDWKDEQSNE